MKLQAILSGMKAIHWAWWALWIGSMTLLGAIILWHLVDRSSELADQFPPWRQSLCEQAKVAATVASFSLFFALAAAGDPPKSSLFMAIAVGSIMLYFAISTMAFMMIDHTSMKNSWRMHTKHERQSLPGKTMPAMK
jgi:hypothetical protein